MPAASRCEVMRIEGEQDGGLRPDRALANQGIVGTPARNTVLSRPAQQGSVAIRIERDDTGIVEEVAFEQRQRVSGCARR